MELFVAQVQSLAVESLRLTSLCSPDPDSIRIWRVRNTNPDQVDFTWDVVGTDQTGSGTVPGGSVDNPGEVTFETVAVDGPNTTRIFVNGEQQDVKASTPDTCDPDIPYEVQLLSVCWVDNPNDNSSAWEVTNPNPVPLQSGPEVKVLYDWEVSDSSGVIQSGQRAEWEPVVSTEEFERGLAILAKRSHMPSPNKRHFYLLQGTLYLDQGNGKVRKLRCSTPNANRARGGVAYYCIDSSDQNYLCWKVDEQIPVHLRAIQVDPALIPDIRKAYLADMGRFTSNRSREIEELQRAIKKLEEKELNLWRGFTEHGMRPQVFEKLSREYEDERQRITAAIDLIHQEQGDVVDNLDAALTVISEIADRYAEHTPARQRDILKQMVKRVVINPEGRIIRMELKPPFNYLDTLAKGSDGNLKAMVERVE